MSAQAEPASTFPPQAHVGEKHEQLFKNLEWAKARHFLVQAIRRSKLPYLTPSFIALL